MSDKMKHQSHDGVKKPAKPSDRQGDIANTQIPKRDAAVTNQGGDRSDKKKEKVRSENNGENTENPAKQYRPDLLSNPKQRLEALLGDLSPKGREYVEKYSRGNRPPEEILSTFEKGQFGSRTENLVDYIENRSGRKEEEKLTINERLRKSVYPSSQNGGGISELTPEQRRKELIEHPDRRFEMPLLDPDQAERVAVNPKREDIKDMLEYAVGINTRSDKGRALLNEQKAKIRAEIAVECALQDQQIRELLATGDCELMTNVVFEREYTSLAALERAHHGASENGHRIREMVDGEGHQRIFYQVGECDILIRGRNGETLLIAEVKSGRDAGIDETIKQVERVKKTMGSVGTTEEGGEGMLHAFAKKGKGKSTVFDDITESIRSSSKENAEIVTFVPLRSGQSEQQRVRNIGLKTEEMSRIATDLIENYRSDRS